MILPDINLLVYAVDESSQFHESSRDWWDGLLSSSPSSGFVTRPCWASFGS